MGQPDEFGDGLITLDINPDRKPDIVWDLENLPLPFEDGIFDEIHAYQVLEHLGSQGDQDQFFGFFNEMYRLIKPKGIVCLSFPNVTSEWVWGDPGHKRFIHPYYFNFLSQAYYKSECDEKVTMTSDYRYIYKGDFEVRWSSQNSDCYYILLEAIK